MASKRPAGPKPIATNRKARHDYDVIDTFECGIVLVGSEVKSLRDGKAQLKDSYARVESGELWLLGVHIPPYSHAHGTDGHEPERRRKLLLHRSEIDELVGRTQQESLTLVPLSMYFKDGRAKVELALARGRKRYDKRQVIAERHRPRRIRQCWRRRPDAGAWATAGGSDGHGRPVHWCGNTASFDMGVPGLDFGRRDGRSEPWSPEPRKRAGKQTQTPTTTSRSLPKPQRCPAGPSPAGRVRASFRRAHLTGLVNGSDRDTSVDWGSSPMPATARSPRSHRRLRSEKSRREAEGRGFDSRHLHRSHVTPQ